MKLETFIYIYAFILGFIGYFCGKLTELIFKKIKLKRKLRLK